MKRIDECGSMAVLTALLVVGILLVMGAYRITSRMPRPSCWGQRACCWRWWAFCWPAAASGGSSTCGTTRNRADYRQRHPGTGRDTPGTDPG